LLIHKAKKAVSISEKECPAGNSGVHLMAIFRFGKVYSSNYFCSGGKLFGFDAATTELLKFGEQLTGHLIRRSIFMLVKLGPFREPMTEKKY
jgi:hypothetical protein